jgi:hypothetical protein
VPKRNWIRFDKVFKTVAVNSTYSFTGSKVPVYLMMTLKQVASSALEKMCKPYKMGHQSSIYSINYAGGNFWFQNTMFIQLEDKKI